MNDLKELKTFYGRVEKGSIFDPHIKDYVNEKEGAERVTDKHVGAYALTLTLTATRWIMPLIYDKCSPEVIAATSISKGMIHNLCKWISADIQDYLDEQLTLRLRLQY